MPPIFFPTHLQPWHVSLTCTAPMFSPEAITNLHDIIRPTVLYLLETNTLSLTYPKHQRHCSVFILIMENFYTPIPSVTKHGLSSELRVINLWTIELLFNYSATSTSCHHMQACDSHAYTLSGFSEIGLYLACQTRNHVCYPKSKKEG